MTSAARASGRHGPSIRRLLAILLGTLAVLVAGLFLVTSLLLRASSRQARVENRQTESFLVADGMRQSSDDLTQMVRLYVSTGQAEYRDHYDEILAIRGGTAPRPRDYDSSFWHRVLAEGKGFVEYGPPQSLVEQMRAARFTPEEFAALNSSLAASDELARLELEVMDRVAARIAQGVDDTYATDVAPDYQRLVDGAYLTEKGVIMGAIGEFTDLVDERTLADVESARRDGRRLAVVQIGILAVIVMVSAGALVVTKRLALTPLDELMGATRRIADGDYAERAEVKGVSELERVADAFNAMATAVEADVAARQRAEEVAVEARRVAEEASRAKSSFLAAMSHEIRTPMIGVTGMLEVLAQSDLTRQQRHMVGTAQSSAAALLQIIGDTLDFSKIEAGRLEISSSTFAVREVVDAAAATFLHTASAKGLRLTATCDERLASAHVGDPLRVRQILSNLLSNAVKFTDVGGIEVTARVLEEPGDDTQSVELAVVDTGPGLTEEQQRRLFDEFAQAEPATTQRYGGTGLGLVICQRLASLMGGVVTMDSAVGTGTTMRLLLTLPVGDPARVVPEASFTSGQFLSSRPTPGRDEAIRERSLVLVAEDHSVNRAVLLHQLDAIGFCADAALDGQEALEQFTTGDYAMVVTDLHMPRLDGYGLAQSIRRHESEHGWPRTPIMALSANVMHGEPQRCREAGMDDFAAKPTTIPLLAAKLRGWLPHLEFPPAPDPLDEVAAGAGPGTEGGERERGAGERGAGDRGEGEGDRRDREQVLDRSVLAELTAGDAALAAAVLRDFVESTAADILRLGDALDVDDRDAARRQAHRIKGASAVVGARRVEVLAARVEAEAGGGVGDLATLRDQLAAALTAVAEELAAEPAHDASA
jgi:signal transduction histidine kinase/CheY-like chemotaxis protein/HPt (histidine-containing phosphotransfer) domain-containing protein